MITTIKNWLGQEIGVGAIVFYGARSGDSSTARIGKVLTVTEKRNKYDNSLESINARVQWIGENRYTVRWAIDNSWMVKASTVNADSLVLIDQSSLDSDVQKKIADLI